MSAYARQFLERMEKPDVDEIDGIAPAVAIRQKNTSRNPRSTVATSTECYDFLRLLFARVGQTFCPTCGTRVRRDTVDEVAARLLELPEGSRWYAIFACGEHGSTQALRDHLFELRKKGFNRLFQGGRLFEFSTPESLLDIDFSKPLFMLVDRLAIGPDLHQRLVDTIEICYREAGEVIFESAGGRPAAALQREVPVQDLPDGVRDAGADPVQLQFSGGGLPAVPGIRQHDRLRHGPRDSGQDALARRGRGGSVDQAEVSLVAGAISRSMRRAACGCSIPYCDLTEGERETRRGVHPPLLRPPGEQEVQAARARVHGRYRGYALCPECRGARLRKQALYVRVGGKNLADVVKMNIAEAQEFFEALELSPEETAIADKILVEIRQRLKFLNDVGLDYLTLDRLSATLSGGEAQRIQLATSLGSRLVGACYVLDEPSIGLHSRDTGRLIRILEELRELGNTIVVVEHDPDVMRAADHIVDLGPGAGEHGGRDRFRRQSREAARAMAAAR